MKDIKPQDLRVDNYIQYNGVIGIVREINHRDVFVHIPDNNTNANWGYTGDQLQGIPLTEKWMRDFGFNNSIGGDSNWWDCKNHQFGGGILYDGGDFELCFFELAPCEHVNQLQNLYFTITGEELTLK